MSASNPSRIPFEMMASGLPVVELYRENNLYDFPNDGCLLADSTPEAIANALLTILDDKKLQQKMSTAGIKYMKNYPLEKGFEEFVTHFNEYMKESKAKTSKIELSYTKDKVMATDELINLSKTLPDVTFVSPKMAPSPLWKRALRKIKRTLLK